MIEKGIWQENAKQELESLLRTDPDVLALFLFGSAIKYQDLWDMWSDVDVFLVVKDGSLNRYYPTTDWLNPLGKLYTFEQSSSNFFNTTRICFDDLRRIDLVITSDSNLKQINEWPQHPFGQGIEVVFSQYAWITDTLSKLSGHSKYSSISSEKFQELVHSFWFKGIMVINKVVRNDLLIALHLALDMVRDCCVLGMILRDRTEGVTYHREGGIGNEMVNQLRSTQQPYTAIGILEMVERSSVAFDDLASQWDENYEDKRFPLLDWMGQARDFIASSE